MVGTYVTMDVGGVARAITARAVRDVQAKVGTVTARRVFVYATQSLDTVAHGYGLPLSLTPALTVALARLARRTAGRSAK